MVESMHSHAGDGRSIGSGDCKVVVSCLMSGASVPHLTLRYAPGDYPMVVFDNSKLRDSNHYTIRRARQADSKRRPG